MSKKENKNSKKKKSQKAVKRKEGTRKKQSGSLKVFMVLGLLLLVGFVIYKTDLLKSMFNKQPGSFDKTFTLLPSEYTGVTFENSVYETPNRGMYFFDYFYNGAGVAVGDINNDNLPDIFFTGNDVPNKLYINKGNFQFEDISLKAGFNSTRWGNGAIMVDINEDGWMDIYVCNSGYHVDAPSTRNELYINTGKNSFIEQAAKYGIADDSRSVQASFFDMDKDGDLDLWVNNHGLRTIAESFPDWFAAVDALPEAEFKRECNTLYRNDGNGKFTDISKQAGIQKVGFGLGLAIRDFNEDGWLDVYVANDFMIPDFMYMNNGDGTFTDRIEEKINHTSYYSMGCDAADFNNDGLTDLVTVDMTPADHVRNKVLMSSMNVVGFSYLNKVKNFIPQYMYNSLFVNTGQGNMSEIGLYSGVSQSDWSWSPLLADFDNDGLKDLMITNGYKKDTKNNDWRLDLLKLQMEKGENYGPEDYHKHLQKAEVNPVPNQMFKNKDGLSFQSVTDDWGLSEPSFSNGAAYADLDQDGDLDLVMNNFDQAAFIYRNNSIEKGGTHFVRFKLKKGASSNAVLHSKINLYYDDKMQSVDYTFSRGYQSFVEPVAHFGLGKQTKVDRAVIYWNDGYETTIENPTIDKLHVIDFDKAIKKRTTKEEINPLFVNESKRSLLPGFVHQENEYEDFNVEILLPHRQSMLGPALAVGDVNGDGLEDFYVGGAKFQEAKLYIQDENMQFKTKATPAFEKDKGYEDTGARFIDVDNDNDLDLYVASGGGGDFKANDILLQDRLYLNNGNGEFTSASGRLPQMYTSTKAIAPIDWDQDGDIDIFVAGRTTPGRYPLPPSSYFLVNDNGFFSNQTSTIAPTLVRLGMITDAEWTDVNEDNLPDLMIVGEWGPITIFKNTGEGFQNDTESIGLEGTNGWWRSLHKADFDNDGDDDFIAGNIGLNNKFHPSKEKPLYLFANDFDHNGSIDIVLSKVYKGNKVPVRGRQCSSTQMPFITEKFPTYKEFATASLEDIYEVSELQEAYAYEAYNFASLYVENKGNGQFELHELPEEAQLAPINGILSNDFDKDGNTDLIIAGNLFQTEVETPQYDAGKGLYLKGLGNGDFETSLHTDYSGIVLPNDVKDIQLIYLGKSKKPAFLVANNNNVLELLIYDQ